MQVLNLLQKLYKMNACVWLAIFVLATNFGVVVSSHKKKEANAFDAFEDALISDRENCYLLKKTFISSARHPPSLLFVTYKIITTNTSDQEYTVGWSSSSVFTTIGPETIWAIQSGVLSLAFRIEAIAVPDYIILTLDMRENGLHLSLSREEVIQTLQEITQRLKPYAIHQEKLTKWDGSNKGFIWDITGTSAHFLWLITIADVLLIIFTAVTSGKMLVKFSKKAHTNVEVGLFWSLTNIATGLNLTELIYHIAIMRQYQLSRDFMIVKGLLLSLAALLAITGILAGCVWKKSLPPFTNSKGFWCCFPVACAVRLIYCFAMCNIFLFVFFTTINIIPTLILVFVYPVIVLSTVTFICTSLFCLVFVFALPLSYDLIIKSSKNFHECKQQCAHLCKTMLYVLPLTAVALLMIPYLEILSSTEYTHSSDLFNDVSSFLPSVIIAAIGIFARRKLRRNIKSKEGMDETDNNLLKIAEEGNSDIALASDNELV